MKKYHLTFDIDWAPDHSIELVLNLLRKYKSKATFFVTHNSDILKDIKEDGHELGIHPNFLDNSSHGKNISDIMECLLNIVPKSTKMRTHGLFQSSNMFIEILKNFPQIKLDLSIFMYRFPFIGKFSFNYEGLSIQRINYNWEDDVAFYDESFNWGNGNLLTDTNILDFHPIHIALNSNNMASYKNLKNSLGKKSLLDCKKSDINNFRNNSVGTFNYLENVLASPHIEISLNEI